MVLLACVLLGASSGGLLAGQAIVERGSSSARARLLRLLPQSGPPLAMPFEMIEIVTELEAQGLTPATPEFSALGLQGRWACRALLAPPLEGSEAPATTFALELGEVQRHFELTPAGGTLKSSAEFELDAIAGRLTVDLDISSSSRADIVGAVTTGRSLELPRLPPTPLPEAMHLLNSQLNADFLGEEGVRLGMQTTYLDPELHITRCITASLSGACAVHVRVPGKK